MPVYSPAARGAALCVDDLTREGMPPLVARGVAATDWKEFDKKFGHLPPNLTRPVWREACRIRFGLRFQDYLRNSSRRSLGLVMNAVAELRLVGASYEETRSIAYVAAQAMEVTADQVEEPFKVLAYAYRVVDAKMPEVEHRHRRPASAPAPRARRPVVARRPARRRPERRSSRQAARRSAGTRRAASNSRSAGGGSSGGGGPAEPPQPPPAQPRRRGDEHGRGTYASRPLRTRGELEVRQSAPRPGVQLHRLDRPQTSFRVIGDVRSAALVLLAVRERLFGGAA